MRNFIVLYLVFNISVYAQTNSTSNPFSQLDYSEIVNNISEHKDNTKLVFKYIDAFSKKAKKEKDTLQLLRCFSFAVFYSESPENKLKYADSIISVANTTTYRNNYIDGHNLRGFAYYDMNRYDKALECFLKVKKLNIEQDFDHDLDIQADYNIGIMKNRLGEYEESVALFKKAYNYYTKEKDFEYATNILPSIVFSYVNVKNIDSASHYNSILKTQLTDTSNVVLLPDYLLNQGAIELIKGKYTKSISHIEQAIPIMIQYEDYHNLQFCYYYLGLNHYHLKDEEKSIKNLMKMDSVFLKINDLHPTSRKGYELLINYHKKNNNERDELIYVNRLLDIDSVINKNYKLLTKTMFKEYDTPNLLIAQERIINNMNSKNEQSKKYLAIAVIILLVLFGVVLHYFNENKKNKKKFNLLFEKTNETTKEIIPVKSEDTINLKINSEVIDDILSKLEQFEKNSDFINSSITLNSLAKTFDTNSKYLSKIVNHYKEKNFSNYLNDLRIEYAVHKLQHEDLFRNYTIKAIGNEVGFNSSESFSKAFHKSTGLKPSFFLRQLNK